MVLGVIDQNGVNPKDRFIVLIQDFYTTDPFAFGVAVTGTFDYPLKDTLVPLPYSRSRSGRCTTGLNKESVAVCDWIVKALPDSIERRGAIPNVTLLTILEKVKAFYDSQSKP